MKIFSITVSFFMFLIGAYLCYIDHGGSGSVIAVVSMLIMMTHIENSKDSHNSEKNEESNECLESLNSKIEKYKCRVRWYEHFLRIKDFNENEFIGVDKLVDNNQLPDNLERRPL